MISECRICGGAIGVFAIKYTDGCCSQECLEKAFPQTREQCCQCENDAVMLNVWHDGECKNFCKECLRKLPGKEKCFCEFDDTVLDDEYYCLICQYKGRAHENKKRYWQKYPHMKEHDLRELERLPDWLYQLKYKELHGSEPEGERK